MNLIPQLILAQHFDELEEISRITNDEDYADEKFVSIPERIIVEQYGNDLKEQNSIISDISNYDDDYDENYGGNYGEDYVKNYGNNYGNDYEGGYGYSYNGDHDENCGDGYSSLSEISRNYDNNEECLDHYSSLIEISTNDDNKDNSDDNYYSSLGKINRNYDNFQKNFVVGNTAETKKLCVKNELSSNKLYTNEDYYLNNYKKKKTVLQRISHMMKLLFVKKKGRNIITDIPSLGNTTISSEKSRKKSIVRKISKFSFCHSNSCGKYDSDNDGSLDPTMEGNAEKFVELSLLNIPVFSNINRDVLVHNRITI